MTNLPEGWIEPLITEVASPDKFSIVDGPFGSDLKLTDYTPEGTVPVLTTQNLTGYYDPTSVRFISLEKFEQLKRSKVEGEDILIAKIGSVGKCCIYPEGAPTAIIPANLCKITAESRVIFNRYLLWQIKSDEFQNKLRDITSATAQPAFSVKRLKTLSIKLAPLAEQRRIVAKLEPLLGSIDAYQQRLVKIPVILKRFRQAVLAAACSGRLTADWREGHSNSYSAMEILKTIDAKELPESEWPDDTIPPTWVWARFGDVISELKNGISLRPELQPPGIPILRISAARPGKVDLSDIRYLLNGEEFISVYKLKDRDLLFTRYNGSLDFLGVCGMARGIGRQVILYPDKLMRVRFGHNLIEPEYAEIFFQTPAAHKRVIAKSKSSAGQIGISGSDIKAQAFALPPLTEQQEIVRRVETLFKLADQIEARYQRAKPLVDKLQQSILAKAFRGELVPTEAELARREGRDYEPDSVLLERIRSERAERVQGRKEKAGPQMKPIKGKVSGIATSKS